MLSFILLALPLLGAFTAAKPAARPRWDLFNLRPRADCDSDNCLRAMIRASTEASSFCSTFIESTVTKTVTPTIVIAGNYTSFAYTTSYSPIPPQSTPTHFATLCTALGANDTEEFRLSNACSCISATPATVTTTVIADATVTSKS